MKNLKIDTVRFHSHLNKQIPVMILLSVLPGVGYVFLSWLHHSHWPAVIWYSFILLFSVWGIVIFRKFNPDKMSRGKMDSWYTEMTWCFYGFFFLWLMIFLIYVTRKDVNLHYIAIFTEIGASVVAATILNSDKKLYVPSIYGLMLPLILYFSMIGEWFGYVLAAFAGTLAWVLLYSAGSSHDLLMKTTFQANHDQLTGLYNRFYFSNYLQQLMNSISESGRYSYLLLIDLDHFKTINDTLGHDTGDELLKVVSSRLGGTTDETHLIARLGGDEFIIAGPEFAEFEQCRTHAMDYAKSLQHRLKENYKIDKHHLYISSSIGVSLIRPTVNKAAHFIKEADIAMYEVKEKGRDGIFLFNDDMSARVERYLELEKQLHFSLKNKEIFLNFQPQFNQEKKITGVEVLVRWHSPQFGNISPEEFIPIAEQTGFIVELGRYIFESSILVFQDWSHRQIELAQFSINISKRQMFGPDFLQYVTEFLENNLDRNLYSKLVFEITESVVAEDLERIIQIITGLKKLDIRFSMDDFGTGYSSLSYLSRLPIDEIKIDRQFVNQLGNKGKEKEMLITILNMASIFELTTVAEGVETEEQFYYLSRQECDYFQGFYLSPPLAKNEFESFYFSRT